MDNITPSEKAPCSESQTTCRIFTLPPELLQMITKCYLPLESAAALALCCKSGLLLLGTSYWEQLRLPGKRARHPKLLFLKLLEKEYPPEYLACDVCFKLHLPNKKRPIKHTKDWYDGIPPAQLRDCEKVELLLGFSHLHSDFTVSHRQKMEKARRLGLDITDLIRAVTTPETRDCGEGVTRTIQPPYNILSDRDIYPRTGEAGDGYRRMNIEYSFLWDTTLPMSYGFLKWEKIRFPNVYYDCMYDGDGGGFWTERSFWTSVLKAMDTFATTSIITTCGRHGQYHSTYDCMRLTFRISPMGKKTVEISLRLEGELFYGDEFYLSEKWRGIKALSQRQTRSGRWLFGH